MRHLLLRTASPLWRRPLFTLARISTATCEPTNQRFSVGPDGTVNVDLDFVEEALGMPAADGFGWARFEFGQVIGPNQRYTIARKLGWGMHSSTWLALDNIASKYVAVKALTGHITGLLDKGMAVWEPDALRLLNAGRRTSPHCLQLLDEFEIQGVGADGRHHCLVTPVYGGDVRALHAANMPLPIQLSKRILLHLLRGIAYAHSRTIVHTDLKHDNIFYNTTMTTTEIEKWLVHDPPRRHPPEMSKDGIVHSAVSQPPPMISIEEALTRTYVLADFGSALPTIACGRGRTVTTPSLRAPEVYLGGEWDEKVDIWSFGCLVFEIITCGRLFRYQTNENLGLDEIEHILLQMICLTGEDFRAEQLTVCPLAAEYFNADCALKQDPEILDWPFEKRIERWSTIVPPAGVTPMADFMRRCLRLDPMKRPSAEELLKDPWFEGVK